MRAFAGSKRRKLAPSARRDSSAIWPASSTPVGPAPTMANVSQGLRRHHGLELRHLEGAEDPSTKLEGVVDRLHPWRVDGVLVVAEVGLRCAGRDDQAVVRQLVARPSVSIVSCRSSTSMSTTSPRTTRALRWRRRTSRIGGAMSPSEARRWRPGRAAAGRGGGSCGPRRPPRPVRGATPWRRTARRIHSRR